MSISRHVNTKTASMHWCLLHSWKLAFKNFPTHGGDRGERRKEHSNLSLQPADRQAIGQAPPMPPPLNSPPLLAPPWKSCPLYHRLLWRESRKWPYIGSYNSRMEPPPPSPLIMWKLWNTVLQPLQAKKERPQAYSGITTVLPSSRSPLSPTPLISRITSSLTSYSSASSATVMLEVT